MLNEKIINKSQYIHELSLGICKIVFRKRTNGRFRAIYGTLDKNKIPGVFQKTLRNALSIRENQNLIPIYDINEQTWKSFYMENVISFTPTQKLNTNKRY